jgi:hypothetical protein
MEGGKTNLTLLTVAVRNSVSALSDVGTLVSTTSCQHMYIVVNMTSNICT